MSFPVTTEHKEILDEIYEQKPLVQDACSIDGKLGCKVFCANKPCEPGEDSLRSVLLLPGEWFYLKERLGEEPKFKNEVEAVPRGQRCPYNVEGRCTAGPKGSLRPFVCRSFPLYFKQVAVRSVELYAEANCGIVKDTFRGVLLKSHLENMAGYLLALWVFIPAWWHELYEKTIPLTTSRNLGVLSFEIDLDVVEYSRDKGPMLVSAELMAAMADKDCLFCGGTGQDKEDAKLNKRTACKVCAGPRFWNTEDHVRAEKESRNVNQS